MKGKATLILSDARSGEVISTVTEENMFTDAIANIIDPAPFTMLYDFSFSDFMKLATPLWERYLGGVMLLSEPVEERADNIFLPGGAKPLATAGGAYSGDDVLRGSLNLNESYPLENGYHFTWDFATDKANGTIACVALTSRPFADSGLNCTGSTANGGKALINHLSSSQAPDKGNFIQGKGQYVGTFEHNTHLFVYANAEIDNTLTFAKVRGVDPYALKLLDVSDCSISTEPYERINVELPFAIDDECYLYEENGIVYFFNSTDNKTEQTTLLEYAGVDVQTMTVVESGSFNTPYVGVSVDSAAVHNGYIWHVSYDCLQKCRPDGTVAAQYDISCNSNARFFVLGNRLYMQMGTLTYDLDGDEPRSIYFDYERVPTYNCDLRAPYVALAVRYSHTGRGDTYQVRTSTAIMGNYLATINNLSSPIVKTEQQVLKIVYEIVNS